MWTQQRLGKIFELTSGGVSMSLSCKRVSSSLRSLVCTKSFAFRLLFLLALLFGGARPGKAPELQEGGHIVADVVCVEHGSRAEDIRSLRPLLPFLFGPSAFATLGFAFTCLQRENDHKNTQS